MSVSSRPGSSRPAVEVPHRGDTWLVAGSALLATCLGRALAPALPGWRVGLSATISELEQLAAFLSQFLVVMGVATALRLLSSSLRYRLPLFRPIAVVCCALALPLILFSSRQRLESSWLVALVLLSGLVGAGAAIASLRHRHSRAAGLVLALVTLGSLVSASARLLALDAGELSRAGLFAVSRGVATGALLLDIASLGVAGLWLARQWVGGAWIASGIGFGALAVGLAAVHGASAAAWRVVMGRALDSLTGHPDPVLPLAVRYAAELGAVGLSAWALVHRGPAAVGVTLCFSLLARVSGDVPLCALMLVLSALCAVRASEYRPASAVG